MALGDFFGGSPPYEQNLKDIASQQSNLAGGIKSVVEPEAHTGQQLEQYLLSGTLPPALQAQVTQQLQQADAALRSRFAGMGLGSSTMETSAENQAALANLGFQGSLQELLFNLGQKSLEDAVSGMAAEGGILGAESGTYQNLAKDQLASDELLLQTISAFTGALGRGAAGGAGGAGGGGGLLGGLTKLGGLFGGVGGAPDVVLT